MSISDSPSDPGAAGASGAGPVGPVGLLAQAVDLVRQANETMWVAQSDEDLVATVELVEQARSALAAVQAGAVVEADVRGVAKEKLHYGSTGDWLTHTAGLRKGGGRRVLRRARALTGPLEATREALAQGRVSPEQADIIWASLRDLPSSETLRARGEQVLVEHAGTFDASDLARTGRHLVHVVDPDTEERRLERDLDREERAAHTDRYLSVVEDGAGGVRVKGRGSAEDGAILKAALLPLTKPAPAPPAADTTQGECARPGVSVADPRDGGVRMWDALVQVAQHALDTDLPPETHGAPARLTLAIPLDTLHDRLHEGLADQALDGTAGVAGFSGVGVTGDGTELSPSTVRRLACDAEVIPAVLGAHGEPLDVGRARRLVTVAIWVALVLRDRHCTFPGCNRPPVMCHAHHIRHWIHGGQTKLDNLALICGHHHRVIH